MWGGKQRIVLAVLSYQYLEQWIWRIGKALTISISSGVKESELRRGILSGREAVSTFAEGDGTVSITSGGPSESLFLDLMLFAFFADLDVLVWRDCKRRRPLSPCEPRWQEQQDIERTFGMAAFAASMGFLTMLRVVARVPRELDIIVGA